jgi:hypothetical protein
VTSPSDQVLAHLGSCFAAPYRVLGEAAPTFSDDAAVVRAYEAARAFGELALAIAERLGRPVEPLGAVAEVLARAVAEDPAGRLALYCVAVVVGPRLLVSLRDARGRVDEDARGLLDQASDLVVGEIVAIRDLAVASSGAEESPGPGAARALGEALDAAGYAESLGTDR